MTYAETTDITQERLWAPTGYHNRNFNRPSDGEALAELERKLDCLLAGSKGCPWLSREDELAALDECIAILTATVAC